ncbi:ABC transporter permease [Rhizobium multihospitium]|uniref:Polar amino acid transport system permease protein n=1 Tax=Rhizobium multihospitium TaxID=410764 RepID=A0A1C3X594_9HYPH|nr:ABC transporter permease subunit [Rhizobium multihospitium]SCB47418.1 polar amino acid transport system permease protein [Rhizobium multihospitium]
MSDLLSPDGWGWQLLKGLWLTIRLALTTLPIGLASGLLLALLINGGNVWLAKIAVLFTTVFRSLPELLTLFIIYFGGQQALQYLSRLVTGHEIGEISGFLAGIIALGIVFASFSSEIFVAGLRAIPRGQREAAAALGLSRGRTFLSVILPQLWRLVLPGLGNLWFVLLKDTALVSVISLNDLMRQTQLAVASTKEPLFFFAITCLIYLAVSLLSSGAISRMEARANRGYVGGRT